MTIYPGHKVFLVFCTLMVLCWVVGGTRGTRSHASDSDDGDSLVYPQSLTDLLLHGLVKTDPESMRIWKESHEQLIEKGVDATQADLALALIFAHAERFEEMRRTLQGAQKRDPDRPETLRLLSWARLSDKQFTEGLEDISKLVAIAIDPKTKSPASSKEEAIKYAGSAFGFAEIAMKEVQPEKHERCSELRQALENLLQDDDKTCFAYEVDAMRVKVTEGLKDTLESKDQKSEEQQAEKTAKKEELEAQQQQMQAEAAHRRQQAMEIETNARMILGELQRAAAPLFAQRRIVATELNRLTSERGQQKEDVDKRRFDAAIASVRGQLDGIDGELQPLINQYNQVEQTALGQLRALGMRVNQLGKIHGANNHRLRQNDAKAANGLTGKLAADLRKRTRLATYMPLDFDAEKKRLLAGKYAASVRLD